MVLLAFHVFGNILKTVAPNEVTEGIFSDAILNLTQGTVIQSEEQEEQKKR